MTWIFALFVTVLAVPAAQSTVEIFGKWTGEGLSEPFLWGAAGGALLGWLIRRFVPVLGILEHEITHMLAAMLMLRRPIAVRADEEGGEAVYEGRGSTFIRLAPYTVPTITLLALPLMPLFRTKFLPGFVMVVGVTWGYHLWRAQADARPHQPDLQRGGLLPSYAAVLALASILFPATAICAVGRTQMLGRWFDAAVDHGRVWLDLALAALP